MPTLMYQEIAQQPSVIRDCYAYNQNICKQVAARIVEQGIDTVYCAARGTSDHAGFFGKYLMEIYLNMIYASAAPSVVTLYGARPRLKGRLTMAISQSGAAADALEVLRCAAAQGGMTLSVTNNEESALAKEADAHLFCNAGQERSVAATKTFTAEAYLLLMLVQKIAELNGSPEAAHLGAVLRSVPAVMEAVLANEAAVEACASNHVEMTRSFVLARGLCFPLAMEAALKLQETCYVEAKAFPISDFHHGPFAMVDAASTVFLYGSSGKAREDAIKILDKLAPTGCSTVVFSSDAELLSYAKHPIQIPKCESEVGEFFAFAVCAQLFAQQLSLQKGLNPDQPRGLNKVTITK